MLVQAGWCWPRRHSLCTYMVPAAVVRYRTTVSEEMVRAAQDVYCYAIQVLTEVLAYRVRRCCEEKWKWI